MLEHLFDWQWLTENAGPVQILIGLAGLALTALGIWVAIWLARRQAKRSSSTADRAPTAEALKAERQALLNNVKTRIDQWFQDGFARQIEIPLRYTAAPEAANQYWLSHVYKGSIEEIPENADIGHLYRSSNGQFLLLGDPGTGKSNELHNLLHALWTKATKDPGEPVPVLLNLTSWAVDQHPSLEDWIAKELQASYQVSAHRSRDWAGRIVPLLDGLDEVREDAQNECLEAIARYSKQPTGGGPGKSVVIASRRKEYDRLIERVKMSAAEVRRLDMDELDALLQDPKLSQLRLTVEADNADPNQPRKLREVVDTPLMLALLYDCGKVGPSREPDPAHRVYGRFFEAAVRNLHGFTAEPAKRWLGWLAAQLENRNEARFDLEDLGPDWLPSFQARLMANSRFGLVFGLAFALLVGLAAGPVFGLVGALVGLVFGLALALASRRRYPRDSLMRPAEVLRFSPHGLWRGLRRGLRESLIGGLKLLLFGGLVGGLVGWLAGEMALRLLSGLALALALGLPLGLAGLLLFGLDGAVEYVAVNERSAPAEGVRRSLRYALRFAAAGVTLGIAPAPAYSIVRAALEAYGKIGEAAAPGLGLIGPVVAAVGAIIGFSKGGYFALRHYSTRFLLWRRNLAPWRYVAFLTQAADKGILKPVGGGFQFRHRELRRFIAERYGAEWLERPSHQS